MNNPKTSDPIKIEWDKRMLLSNPPRRLWEYRLPVRGEGDLSVMVSDRAPLLYDEGSARVVVAYPDGTIKFEVVYDTFEQAEKHALEEVVVALHARVRSENAKVADAESVLASAKRSRDEWTERLTLWKRVER